MGFTHAYLVSLAECWRRKPDKMAERSKLWPETLTWTWFLDPDRITQWDVQEQIEILSVATMHAHKVKVPLTIKPAEIFRRCKRLAEKPENDPTRLQLYRWLGAELDRFDGEVAAQAKAAAEAELERQRVARETAEQAEREAEEQARLSEEERIAKLSDEQRAEEARAAELERAELERVELARAARAADLAALKQRYDEGSLSPDEYERIGELEQLNQQP